MIIYLCHNKICMWLFFLNAYYELFLLTTLLTPNVWVFSFTQPIFSDNNYLELVQTPQHKGSTLHGCCDFRCLLLAVLLTNQLENGSSQDPLPQVCGDGSQNSRKHFTYYYWFIIKDTTQEKPKEKRHGARYWGEVWGMRRASVFSQYITLPAPWCILQPGGFLNPDF